MPACAPEFTPSSLPSEVGGVRRRAAPALPRARPRLRRRSARPASARPPLDVYETDDALEIADGPAGRRPGAVRVVAKGDAVLIAGEKAPRRGRGDSSFHLVERGYGRFARVDPPDAAVRHRPRARHARARRAARSRCRRSPSGAAARMPIPITTSSRSRDPHPLHRRHRRPAGPRAGPPRAGGARRPSSDRPRRSPTPRTPPPASASRARSATSSSTGAST